MASSSNVVPLCFGKLQRRDRILVLGREAKRRAARCQNEQAWRCCEQPRDHVGVGHELFEVVEQQQHALVAEMLGQRLLRRGAFRHIERVRDRRLEQLRIANRREVDEDGAVAKLGAELGGDGEREPRLAGSARAGQRHEPHVVAPEQAGDRRGFEPAADERRGRHRQPNATRLGRFRGGERGVLAQHLPLELLQLGAGVDAQLLDECVARSPVGLERVSLTAGPVEREHVLVAEPFAEWVRGDEPFELGDELVVPSERELGVVQQLERTQTPVLEPCCLRLRNRLAAEIGEGRATPEAERRPQVLRRIGRL